MAAQTQRAHERIACEIPILFSPNGSNNHYHGTLRNFSQGGMYIESLFAIPEGSYIIVKADKNRVPVPANAGLGDIRELEVKWFTEISSSSPSKFGCGLRYLSC